MDMLVISAPARTSFVGRIHVQRLDHEIEDSSVRGVVARVV